MCSEEHGAIVHAYNSSSRKVNVEGPRVQDGPVLCIGTPLEASESVLLNLGSSM